MLKRLDRNYSESSSSPDQEKEKLSPDPLFYSEDNDKELKALEKELHARAEALGNVQNIPQAPAPEISPEKLAEVAPDPETKEFVNLVEFVQREHGRQKQLKDPGHKAKVVKLKSYQKVKERDFEKKEKQKGLQLDKAA